MSLRRNTTQKFALFLGASNTFGVGLHTFRDVYMSETGANKLTWPYNQVGIDNEFIRQHRWTNIVSNYINRKEINIAEAGGSPAESLHRLEVYEPLTNIDYIFFEFSAMYSYFDKYVHGGDYPRTPLEIEAFLTNGKNDRPELRERIINWLINYNPTEFINEVLLVLKHKLETYADKKVIILLWRECEIDVESKEHSWLKKYLVRFPTQQNENNYVVQNLLEERKLRVMDEYPFYHILKRNYPETIDIHAGLKGNKLIADIIINHLDEKKLIDSR